MMNSSEKQLIQGDGNIKEYDFDNAVRSWSRIPLDEFGYQNVLEILYLSPFQRAVLLSHVWTIRYSLNHWINLNNCLIEFMNPAAWREKRVLDFGCGIGLDGSVFGSAGANVSYADISPSILVIAQQAFSWATYRLPERLYIVLAGDPFVLPENKFDLIWSFGCLHHTPKCGDILKRFCSLLNPDGEIKVGLYSDHRWREFTGCEPPEGDVTSSPHFMKYVRTCDAVGDYADWYDENKLRNLVEGFAIVKECRYICKDKIIGATLVPVSYD